MKYITRFNEQIIAATSTYLVFLRKDIETDFNLHNPKVHLVQVDKYLDIGGFNISTIIREYVRNVTIKYTTFNYTNPEALTYKYRVDQSDWITTKKNEIEISSLGYGEHDIEIMASYYGGKFGPRSTIAVYMMPPFWHSYYFYLLCLLSLSAFIYHVIKSRQGILKYHSRGFLHNQLLIENLKTRTVTNNLNPHFIYNAINSIKYFLKKKSLNK